MEVSVARRYDVIVVGAGPAGLVAAKAIGENGFEVALLERKTDIKVLNRACGQTLDSANEYLHHDLFRCNIRDKRLSFPAHGFSVKYDGPYRNAYCHYFYSPNGNRIQSGVYEEQKEKGDYGKITAILDIEILFRCLLEEVEAYNVKVFPGINVNQVTTSANGVHIEGSGQNFEGRYLIAADGVNSRIARLMGFNEDRTYYCQLRALAYDWFGAEPPDPDAVVIGHSFMKAGPVTFFIIPQAQNGIYHQAVLTIDPRVDLETAEHYFIKESFYGPWFKNAKIVKTLSANVNCYSPIVEAYQGRVLIAGDVGSTQELEITGAMISGWKAGHSVSVALQEENLGLEVKALDKFANWWKEAYINYYSHNTYMKTWAFPFILTKPEEIDYLLSLIKEPLPPCFNPYTMGNNMREVTGRVMPIIQRERPEIARKLERGSLPVTELLAEVTKLSEPLL
jgi:flavin-dependent dehydrogenase